MDVVIRIEDFVIKRLNWKDLDEAVDRAFEAKKAETLRVLKAARREFGLEVGDGEGETGDETNE